LPAVVVDVGPWSLKERVFRVGGIAADLVVQIALFLLVSYFTACLHKRTRR
jgi:hypothetical protein